MEIDSFLTKLKSPNDGHKIMSDYEKQLLFTVKYDGVEDEGVMSKYAWATTDNVREMYVESLSNLQLKFRQFINKLDKIQEAMVFNSEGY